MKVSMTRTLVRVHGKFCRRLGNMPLSHGVSLSQVPFFLGYQSHKQPGIGLPERGKAVCAREVSEHQPQKDFCPNIRCLSR